MNHADGQGLTFRNGQAISPNRTYYDLRICPGCKQQKYIGRKAKFCSRACGATKPGPLDYHGSHVRVYRIRGKATSCIWGCLADKFFWANLTGDFADPDDYAQMCHSKLHSRYDAARASMEPGDAAARYKPVRLNADLVREIRTLRAAGERVCAIARRYGVHSSTVSLIVNGRTWRWV